VSSSILSVTLLDSSSTILRAMILTLFFSNTQFCLFTWCCPLCATCDVAAHIGGDTAETHGVGSTIKMCVINYFVGYCAVCCCIDQVFPCWSTSLEKAALAKLGIDTPPGPCGDAGCCNFWWQQVCCFQCTLCLIKRQLNKDFPK
jgi:hypothetical protein